MIAGLYRCSPDEELRALFNELDADGSGGLDKQELADLVPLAQVAQQRSPKGGKNDFTSKPLTPAELSVMMKEIDEDDSGSIDYGEFKRWWRRSQGHGELPKVEIDEESAVIAAVAASAFEAKRGPHKPTGLPATRSATNPDQSSEGRKATLTPTPGGKPKTPNTPKTAESDGRGSRGSSPKKEKRGDF